MGKEERKEEARLPAPGTPRPVPGRGRGPSRTARHGPREVPQHQPALPGAAASTGPRVRPIPSLANAAQQSPELAPPRPPHSRPASCPGRRNRARSASMHRSGSGSHSAASAARASGIVPGSRGPPAPSRPPVSEPVPPRRHRSAASSSTGACGPGQFAWGPGDPDRPINNQFLSFRTAGRPGWVRWPPTPGRPGGGEEGLGARVPYPAPVLP